MFRQIYSLYTETDHHTWSVLFTRQIKKIRSVAYQNFEKGLGKLDFGARRIPDFRAVNEHLKELNGWQIYAVPGLIDNGHFFQQMFNRRFGATTWIRKPEELDYLEEPDMFHDVFGHIPLLTDPLICKFLHGLAKIAVVNIDDEETIEALARLYWYTVEFGLVKENGQLKIYGAGILSSIGETGYCLSEYVKRIPFNLEMVLAAPYVKDKFQEQYFVLEAMEQLEDLWHDVSMFQDL
jgi:phenylalanine-4-hydroxylase